MARKKLLTTFELIFSGEELEIVCRLVGGQGEEGMPLVINGFFLDLDKDYLYLGNTPDQVTQAVKRDTIVLISIVHEPDELRQALLSVPTPRNKNEGN